MHKIKTVPPDYAKATSDRRYLLWKPQTAVKVTRAANGNYQQIIAKDGQSTQRTATAFEQFFGS